MHVVKRTPEPFCVFRESGRFDYPYLNIWPASFWDLLSIAWTEACRPGGRKFPWRQSHNSSRSFLTKGRELEHPSKTTSLPHQTSSSLFLLYHDSLTILYDFYVSASPCFIGMSFVPHNRFRCGQYLHSLLFFSCLFPGNVMTIHQLAPVIERTCTLFIDDNALASASF